MGVGEVMPGSMVPRVAPGAWATRERSLAGWAWEQATGRDHEPAGAASGRAHRCRLDRERLIYPDRMTAAEILVSAARQLRDLQAMPAGNMVEAPELQRAVQTLASALADYLAGAETHMPGADWSAQTKLPHADDMACAQALSEAARP